jgi:type IV pilus assembly protein PilQ
VLGDIPVMGNLFRQTARKADKTELLIFLTPKVLSDKLAVR